MLTDKDLDKLNTLIDSKFDLFKTHIDTRFESLEEDISAIRETVQHTAVAIDKQAGVNQELREEFAMMNGQLSRHERWIKKLADKTEVKLEY